MSGLTQYTKQFPLCDYGTGDDTIIEVLTYVRRCSTVCGVTGTRLLNICTQMSLNRRADDDVVLGMLAMIFRELFCVLSLTRPFPSVVVR